MKKFIFAFLIKSVIFTGVYAQSDIASKHAGNIDSLLNIANIASKDIQTGILYDRAIPLAGLQRFKQTDTINRGYFLQAANELRNAAYDKKKKRKTKELRNIANRYTYRDNLTPIGILFSEFTHIDTLAGEKDFMKIDRDDKTRLAKQLGKEDLVNKKVLLAASLSRRRELDTKVSFVVPEELMTGNRISDIRRIKVDFDDGRGSRDIKPGKVVDINYATAGKKTITLNATTNDGDTFKSTSNVMVRDDYDGEWGEYGEIPDYHRDIEIEADISYTCPDGYNFPGEGQLTYLMQDNDNGLQKPVLIVNGFDPDEKISDRILFFDYLNNESIEGGKYKFADELHDYGYDIVILDFPNWWSDDMDETIYVDYIQRNALVVAAAIDTINDQLANNNSNEELVVVGASMGGLTTRYALAYMEQNNMDHNTRLWISLDSPQKGANIPIGLQKFLRIFAELSEEVEEKLEINLRNPAAKQMLLDYYSSYSEYPEPHLLRDYWINDLESMEFPAQPRNIAISNGSLNSTILHQTTGEEALMLEVKCPYELIILAWAKIFTTESYGERTHVTITYVGGFPFVFAYAIGLEDSYGLDSSPGGYRKTFKQITEESSMGDNYSLFWNLHIEDHSFIPTKSALAYSGYNPDLSEDLSDRNLISTGETPFHSYWAPVGKNMEHGTLFDEDLMVWLLQEINNTPMPPSVITGPSHACNSELYQVEYLPDDVTVSWSWSPQPVFSYETPCPGEALCVTVNEFFDNVIITAEISHSDWDENIKFTRENIKAGTPTPIIQGPMVNGHEKLQLCIGEVAHFVATNPHPDVDEYHWTVHGGDFPIFLGNQQTSGPFFASDPGWYYVEAKQHIPDCGWSAYATKDFSIIDCGMLVFNVYPNPATSTLNIEATIEIDSYEDTFDENTTYQVKLYNWDAHLMRTSGFTLQESSHQIDISHLTKGKHILHITDDEELLHKEQVVIE